MWGLRGPKPEGGGPSSGCSLGRTEHQDRTGAVGAEPGPRLAQACPVSWAGGQPQGRAGSGQRPGGDEGHCPSEPRGRGQVRLRAVLTPVQGAGFLAVLGVPGMGWRSRGPCRGHGARVITRPQERRFLGHKQNRGTCRAVVGDSVVCVGRTNGTKVVSEPPPAQCVRSGARLPAAETRGAPCACGSPLAVGCGGRCPCLKPCRRGVCRSGVSAFSCPHPLWVRCHLLSHGASCLAVCPVPSLGSGLSVSSRLSRGLCGLPCRRAWESPHRSRGKASPRFPPSGTACSQRRLWQRRGASQP